MTGDERTNPAKALLLRIVPAGLITYLKHTPPDEGQKEVLDDIEYEYYTQYMNNSSMLLSRPHIGAASLHSQVNTVHTHEVYYTNIYTYASSAQCYYCMQRCLLTVNICIEALSRSQ